ncbi:MAG: ABC transporter ATP-binding protein/permease [Nannocystaceae bacterium]|nr:ABC transporter ATP-binding protein/permease [Nannocystaceae bacterium]
MELPGGRSGAVVGGRDLANAIEHVARAAGLSPDAVATAAVADARLVVGSSAGLRALERSSARAGLTLRPCSVPLRRLGRDGTWLGLSAPGADGATEVVVVWARRLGGHQLSRFAAGEVVHERRSAGALASLLGCAADGVAVGLCPGVALPLDAMRASGQALSPWQRARRMLALDGADIGIVLVYAIAIGLLSLATPVAVQALVNNVAFGSLLQPVVVLTVLLALGLAAWGTVRLLQVVVVETIMQRVFVRTVADFGRRLAAMDTTALDRTHAPDLLNRLFEIPPMQKALATLLVEGTGLLLQLAVGFLLLAVYHPLLLVFASALSFVLALVVFGLGRGAVDTALAESKGKYEAAGWLEHLARLPTAFRSARGRAAAIDRSDRLAYAWLQRRRAHFRRLLLQHGGGVAIAVLGSAAVLGLGGVLVLRQQLTLGQLVAAELVVGTLGAAMVKLGKQLESAYDVVTSATKLALVVDLPAERSGGDLPRSDGAAALSLRRVAFAHAGRGLALRDLDLCLAPREHALIHGSGGSGKSTLLDLIYGLRTPTRGRVELDGLDLRQLELPAVREHVALVREGDLVHASLLDNLRLAAPDAPLAEVQAAVTLVGLDEVVLALPEGLDTMVMPSGQPLSASETRRVALARALLARPRLLLLDGTLDHLGLEPEAHARLCAALFDAAAPWTAIVTAQDDALAPHARRVARLGDRTLVEVRP